MITIENEVDIIIKYGNQLIPVEIKSSQTFNQTFMKGITCFKKNAGDRVSQCFIIYTGEQEQQIHSTTLLNYKHILAIWHELEQSS